MGRLKLVAVVIALCVSLLGVACMGTAESPANLRITTPTPTPDDNVSVAASPTRTALASPTPEPTAAETPSPAPQAGPIPDGLAGVLAAASTALGVPAGDDCVEGEDCIQEMPGGSTRSDGPIVRLAYVSAAGGGAMVVMARDIAGAWKFWMLTQIDHYQLLDVPGRLRACSDTPSLTVRTQANRSAASAGEVPHGEVMQAESFALTQAGSLDGPGAGWYQVSSPVAGWVPSQDTADAASGNCNLRNEVESAPGTIG